MGLSCASNGNSRPGFSADSSQAREAAVILQGIGKEKFVADSAIHVVALALYTIRATYPEVRDVRDQRPLEFELRLDSTVVKGLCTARLPGEPLPEPIKDTVDNTGLPAVDSANRQFGAVKVHVQSCFGRWIHVFPLFPRFPNIPAMAKHYERLPGVLKAGEPMYVSSCGGPNSIQMTGESRSKRFLFVQRSHSCVGQQSYEFRYWPETGRVEKLHRKAALLERELPTLQMQLTVRRGPKLGVVRGSSWPGIGNVHRCGAGPIACS
jgi:hypothetical protein